MLFRDMYCFAKLPLPLQFDCFIPLVFPDSSFLLPIFKTHVFALCFFTAAGSAFRPLNKVAGWLATID